MSWAYTYYMTHVDLNMRLYTIILSQRHRCDMSSLDTGRKHTFVLHSGYMCIILYNMWSSINRVKNLLKMNLFSNVSVAEPVTRISMWLPAICVIYHYIPKYYYYYYYYIINYHIDAINIVSRLPRRNTDFCPMSCTCIMPKKNFVK